MPLTTLHRIHCHLTQPGARSNFQAVLRFPKKYPARLTMFCQSPRMLHHLRMKLAFWISAACALPFILTGCGNSGGGGAAGGGVQQPGIGPFDSQGRYREEWADNPSQWRKPGGSSPRVTKTEDVPQIAQNEQPPLNSVPLATSTRTYTPKPTIGETRTVTKTTTTRKESEGVVVKTRPLNKGEPEIVKAKPKAKPEADVVKTKSKPKTVAKTKPKSSRYVVKQGDSLSSIASRNGSSVSALQRENGLSSTLIRPGQSLTIPRK